MNHYMITRINMIEHSHYTMAGQRAQREGTDAGDSPYDTNSPDPGGMEGDYRYRGQRANLTIRPTLEDYNMNGVFIGLIILFFCVTPVFGLYGVCWPQFQSCFVIHAATDAVGEGWTSELVSCYAKSSLMTMFALFVLTLLLRGAWCSVFPNARLLCFPSMNESITFHNNVVRHRRAMEDLYHTYKPADLEVTSVDLPPHYEDVLNWERSESKSEYLPDFEFSTSAQMSVSKQ